MVAHVHNDPSNVIPATPLQGLVNKTCHDGRIERGSQHYPDSFECVLFIQPVCTDQKPVTNFYVSNMRFKI